MTAEQAQALYDAEARGVRQIRGAYRDDDGGRCAMGVLNDHLLSWGFICSSVCPACGFGFPTVDNLIIHLNDDHCMTFSEIARKLGPDSVQSVDLTDEAHLMILEDFARAVLKIQGDNWIGKVGVTIERNSGLITYIFVNEESKGIRVTL